MEIIHGRIVLQTWDVDTSGGGRETYVESFPQVLTSVECQVEGFPVRDHLSARLRGQFMYRHWKYQVEIP